LHCNVTRIFTSEGLMVLGEIPAAPESHWHAATVGIAPKAAT
jgi:hypothetical protein